MPGREDESPKGFKVTDRRRFDETGAPREGVESPAPVGASTAAHEALRGGPQGPDPSHVPSPVGAPPEERPIDFVTFVFSLGSSAMIHLGEAPNPETGTYQKDLPLAQETIDLLTLLQQKTRGNLTPEEDRFLGALLYDLRLRFVEARKAP